ncbi:ribosome silencing factor [candidate division WOR-3 bacterium]|nr:ribosome silencing factor [candidate division WOR-3 bacterium]
MMEARELARTIARLLVDRHAEDVTVMDLTGHSSLADYFVVATAGSTVHAQGLARATVEQLAERGERCHHQEGSDAGRWVLLDYITVVVHIFLSDVRQFYGLERLWGDLPQERFPATEA